MRCWQCSNVNAPALNDLAIRRQVTITWTVTNDGTGPTTALNWTDAVIASPDANPADGTKIGSFTESGPLSVGEIQ